MCTVTNSYGAFPDRSICEAAKVEYPKTEAELVSAVAAATRAGRKMRVVSRYSHSIPKLVCTDGKDGILISTKFLNNVVRADREAKTLTVESGVTLRQLIGEAAKLELALPYAPYWWGLTVGGIMGTGAHGSSLWGKGSAVHDYVTEIRIVSPGSVSDGYVKVRVLSETVNPEEFRAAKVSLGVLGVISQVTFELQPMFKRSLTYVMRKDWDFGDQAVTFGEKHEFADFIWLPSQGKVVYRMDDRVPFKTSGDGLFDFFPFRPQLSTALAVNRLRRVKRHLQMQTGENAQGNQVQNSGYQRGYGNQGRTFVLSPAQNTQFHNQKQPTNQQPAQPAQTAPQDEMKSLANMMSQLLQGQQIQEKALNQKESEQPPVTAPTDEEEAGLPAKHTPTTTEQPTVVVRPAAEPVPTRDYVPKVPYPVSAKTTRKDKEEMKCRKMLEDIT
uniref:L-gulonolactone oxidase n=1 Tax=Brassica oleracea var. oleracea TaxID=109376 RepID=A0A0D2ZUM2_BRAOL